MSWWNCIGRGKCLGANCPGECLGDIQRKYPDPIENYKPLFVAAMIYGILVNTQTHIQTYTDRWSSPVWFHIYCVLCFVSLHYLYFCTVCIVYDYFIFLYHCYYYLFMSNNLVNLVTLVSSICNSPQQLGHYWE